MLVVPAVLVIVMLVGAVVPANANPFFLLLGLKLLDKLTEHKETVSDSAAYANANFVLDGKTQASVFGVATTVIVAPKMSCHTSLLVLDPHLVIRPALTDGITGAELHSNSDPDSVFDENYAREVGIRNGARIPRKGEKWERKWLVAIDVNKLSFGLHTFDFDVYFRNGSNKRDSFRMPVQLFVTSVADMQAGVNSPTIQNYLRQLSGQWTTVPITGTIDLDLSDEGAKVGGFADRAISAGIPASGAVETKVIGSEQAQQVSTGNACQDKLGMYARSAGIQPRDLFTTEEVQCEAGPRGIPFVVAFLDAQNNMVNVPAGVTITDSSGRSYPPVRSAKGDGVIAVQGLRGGETIRIEVGGQDTGASMEVRSGRGFWLIVKPGGA